MDGIYGPTTIHAVKVIQQHADLPSTGIVDHKTWGPCESASSGRSIRHRAPGGEAARHTANRPLRRGGPPRLGPSPRPSELREVAGTSSLIDCHNAQPNKGVDHVDRACGVDRTTAYGTDRGNARRTGHGPPVRGGPRRTRTDRRGGQGSRTRSESPVLGRGVGRRGKEVLEHHPADHARAGSPQHRPARPVAVDLRRGTARRALSTARRTAGGPPRIRLRTARSHPCPGR
ncbi:peptidoglycan-binding protein [Streptomyces morookaense]|uniref:Peptidoglycan-binding protein n=1 Tax=Streptomyces morookaense TaxID=1970 RepID=A0A7Y7B6P8_STRMO|nr:peptidoglycan-binding protein [Streptomyces morookaense]